MTVSKEIEAKILRYYHVEKWRVGTIATQLGVHHSVVTRVLSSAGITHIKILKTSIAEPYIPFITDTLAKFPRLTARRIYEMVRERGYPGGPDHFRYIVSLHRPTLQAEAYLRLKTLPGEQAQVDWGHFGHIIIGRAKRPLMAFVMVLSHSRKIFLRFYLNSQMSNFLDGHEAAFSAFNGCARVLLYDNLRSAVLEREGDAIRFHPTLLAFAAHYRYEPRPVAIARGNEKGRVERAIRYIRDNFFAAREWTDLADLNEQAQKWCEGIAADRPCPEDPTQSVRAMFELEKTSLMILPDNPFPTHEQVEVKVGKTPYVRFDLNDYSVPHTCVRRTLSVNATGDTVSIYNGVDLVAKHERSYEKGQQIEDESHIQGLVFIKKQARLHRDQDKLSKLLPSCNTFLIKAAERHYSLRSVTRQLSQLLERYGALELEQAIVEALHRDVPHPNAVQLALENNRLARHQNPPINLDLPNDKRINEQVVQVHKLDTYDQLKSTFEENENE